MNVGDMIDEMDDYEFDDLNDSRKIELLNDKYQDICTRFNWSFLEDKVTVTIDSDGLVTPWPDNISKPKKIYLADDPRKTNLFNYRDFFFTEGDNFVFASPTRYNNKDLVLEYYITPDDLADPEDEPIFPSKFHRVVVLGGLSSAFFMSDDEELGIRFDQMYEARILRMAAALLPTNVAPKRVIDVGY